MQPRNGRASDCRTSQTIGKDFILEIERHDPHELVRASKCLVKTRKSSNNLASEFVQKFLYRMYRNDGDLSFNTLQTMMGLINGVFFAHNLKGRMSLTFRDRRTYDPDWHNPDFAVLGYCAG